MVMEVGSLDAGGLRTLLRERAAQCLLLDCRSFFAFNAGHIAGSVNVRFSTIVRRRAKGAMGLEHIVPNAELRGRLLAGAYHAVVLLDERSAALDAAKRDGTLALAAGALSREARAAAQVFFLKGGYEAFSASCPELCSKQSTPMGLSLPLSTNVPDSAESGCSSCSTPLYDQGGPVEILPFLYLGSAYHASRKDMLDALGITALINVSANCPNHFEGHYQYKSIPVEDNHKADISSWFNEAIDFIGKWNGYLRLLPHSPIFATEPKHYGKDLNDIFLSLPPDIKYQSGVGNIPANYGFGDPTLQNSELRLRKLN